MIAPPPAPDTTGSVPVQQSVGTIPAHNQHLNRFGPKWVIVLSNTCKCCQVCFLHFTFKHSSDKCSESCCLHSFLLSSTRCTLWEETLRRVRSQRCGSPHRSEASTPSDVDSGWDATCLQDVEIVWPLVPLSSCSRIYSAVWLLIRLFLLHSWRTELFSAQTCSPDWRTFQIWMNMKRASPNYGGQFHVSAILKWLYKHTLCVNVHCIGLCPLELDSQPQSFFCVDPNVSLFISLTKTGTENVHQRPFETKNRSKKTDKV